MIKKAKESLILMGAGLIIIVLGIIGFFTYNFVSAQSYTLATITLSQATNVTATSVTLNGNITDTGGDNPNVIMYWGPSDGGANPNNWANPIDLGKIGKTPFSTTISGNFTAGIYYFTASATNAAGTSWPSGNSPGSGNSPSFTTPTQVFTTINVAPAPAGLVVGGTQQLTATALDQYGFAMSLQPTFTWASNNTAVATVNSSGLVTAVSQGTANITASSGAITSSPSVITVSATGATGGNVYGWAWSENIGWISFNQASYGSIPGGGGSNYGVNINTDGTLSGYAWSENIGWIRFNPVADLVTYPGCGYPAAPCYSAKADLTGNHPVTGWARACSVFSAGCDGDLNSNRGGWDGWIKLHNILIDTSITPAEFHYWVWGGNPDNDPARSVIGWGTFNCLEGSPTGTSICGIGAGKSNYKVVTTFLFSGPPQVQSMEESEYDCFASGASSVSLKWTYAGANNETEFKIQVSQNSAFSSIDFYADYTGLNNPSGTQNTQSPYVKISPGLNDLSYGTTYYWRVKVYDNQGNVSGWTDGPTFTTASHAWPSPKFTFTPSAPLINKVVSFTDSSTCYDANNVAQSCSATGSRAYTWTFDVGNTSNVKGDTSYIYTKVGTYSVTLKICEAANCCSATNNVNVKKPKNVPSWQEISPF